MSDFVRPVLLVVDDEPENLALLERTLGFDYDVHTASSGEEALKILPNLPDLAVIITDQRMPGMTGTELLTQARIRRADAVRIILTGYISPDDLIDAINSSRVYRYLTKPWDVEKLSLAVQHAVRLYEMGGGALVDEATGLPNRGLMRRELERELGRSARVERSFAVVSAMLAGYERLVQAAGQAAAEKLMVVVAQELSTLLRPIDTLGVYADGAFLVILPECSSPASLVESIGKQASLAARTQAAGLELRVRSVVCERGVGTLGELLRALDLAS